MKKTTLLITLSFSFYLAFAQSFTESMFMDYEFSDGTKPTLHVNFTNVGKDAIYDAVKTAF